MRIHTRQLFLLLALAAVAALAGPVSTAVAAPLAPVRAAAGDAAAKVRAAVPPAARPAVEPVRKQLEQSSSEAIKRTSAVVTRAQVATGRITSPPPARPQPGRLQRTPRKHARDAGAERRTGRAGAASPPARQAAHRSTEAPATAPRSTHSAPRTERAPHRSQASQDKRRPAPAPAADQGIGMAAGGSSAGTGLVGAALLFLLAFALCGATRRLSLTSASVRSRNLLLALERPG